MSTRFPGEFEQIKLNSGFSQSGNDVFTSLLLFCLCACLERTYSTIPLEVFCHYVQYFTFILAIAIFLLRRLGSFDLN